MCSCIYTFATSKSKFRAAYMKPTSLVKSSEMLKTIIMKAEASLLEI